ncbi:MAG: hypothetical protein IPN06_14270, partial [Burkholderiales bacterium]|nr:hypothetical protein [Burkholderiales bacterium]
MALTDAQREAMGRRTNSLRGAPPPGLRNATEVSIDLSGAIRWFIDLTLPGERFGVSPITAPLWQPCWLHGHVP